MEDEMTEEPMELLFFDTFSHETNEEANLDLVQFPKPIFINEVRVIPLGSRVQADFPGGTRLGATNPSQFHVDFFINDLSKNGASTFLQLGSLDYKHNVDIQMCCSSKAPTDGLVLHGWYTTITLAIFGTLTKVVKEKVPTPPPPPPVIAVAPVTIKPKLLIPVDPVDHCVKVEKCSIEDWVREAREETALQNRSAKKCRTPELPQQFPIPTYHTQHQEYPQRWPKDEPMAPAPTEQRAIAPQPSMLSLNYAAPPQVMPLVVEPIPPPLIHRRLQSVRDDKPATPSPREPREPPREQSRDEHVSHRESGRGGSSSSSSYRERDNKADGGWSEQQQQHHRSERGNSGRDRRSRDRDRSRDDRGERWPLRGDLGGSSSGMGSPRTPPPSSFAGELSTQSRQQPQSPIRERCPRTPPMPPPCVGPSSPLESPPRDSHTPEPLEEGMMAPPKAPPALASDEPEEAFEPVTPETSPLTEAAEAMSDGDPQDAGYPDYGYEEIVSDEEEMSESEDRILEFQGDLEYDTGEDAFVTSFDPYRYELNPLVAVSDPSLTPFEVECRKKPSPALTESSTSECDEAGEKLVQLLQQGQDKRLAEKWVEIVEVLPSSVATSAAYIFRNGDIQAVLLEWCCDALDFDLALQQTQAVFKVRHLKAGIKLAAALFGCHRDFVNRMLARGIQRKLIELYNREYMALSLKLLILKALDASLRTKAGMQALLMPAAPAPNNSTPITNGGSRPAFAVSPPPASSAENKVDEATDVTGSEVGSSCYQMLLDILLSKQMARASVALVALLNKVHLYEALANISTIVNRIVDSCSAAFPATLFGNGAFSPAAGARSTTAAVATDTADDPDVLANCARVWTDHHRNDLQTLVKLLQEILQVVGQAEQTIAQPRRSLPVAFQFDIPKNSGDVYPALYALLRDCRFVDVLLLLLSFPPTAAQPTIVGLIKELLSEITSRQHGLLFLLAEHDTTNLLLRALLQSGQDEGRDETAEEPALQPLGLRLVHLLHPLQCVATLLLSAETSHRHKEIDEPDVLAALHALYAMTFTPQGRLAVVHTLSAEGNLKAVLPFVQFIGEEEYDMKLRTSACFGYATDLLLMTVRFSENVGLLERFAEKLFVISAQEAFPKLQELSSWLAPIQKLPAYNHMAVPYLCGLLKEPVEDVMSFPGDLITTLRLLCYICVPPKQRTSPYIKESPQEELKYKYAVVQLFANNAMPHFMSILQTICETYRYLPLHTSSLVGQKGALLIAVVKPTVTLVLSILSHLIRCRDSELKDLTSLPVLLRTYSLLLGLPTAASQFSGIQKIQEDLIDTLLAFTQPDLDVSESEEALNSSLWTKMIKEVLQFSISAPCTFMSGLGILSELLPIPLPIHSQEPLHPSEVAKAVTYRKLWSAHLHSLSPLIQEVIVTLAGSGDQNLQQLLRRVFIQLADLSSPTSLIVIRGLVDTILESLLVESKSAADLSHLSRLLSLLSYLTSQACVKAAFLHLMKGMTKIDKKYSEFFPKLIDLLVLPPESLVQPEKPSTLQHVQECIASIFQSLCDTEITLIPTDSQMPASEQLANALPCKEQVMSICGALWDHLTIGYSGTPSILISLRALVLLSEHDFGIYHLKTSIEKRPDLLRSFLSVLCKHFVRDNPDFLSTVSTFLELLHLVVNADGEESQTYPRTLDVSPAELALYVRWLAVQPPKTDPVGQQPQPTTLSAVAEMETDEKLEAGAPMPPQPEKKEEDETATVASSADVKIESDNTEEEKISVPIAVPVVAAESVAAALEEAVPISEIHPLVQLEKLLVDSNRDEECLESQILDNVQSLIQMLNEGSTPAAVAAAAAQSTEKAEIQELPPAHHLAQQFALRMTYLVGDVDDEGLSSLFWLVQSNSGDDSDQENEHVTFNLQALADQHCPGLNFASELGKLFLAKDDSALDGDGKKLLTAHGRRRCQPLINPGTKDPPRKKPFIAPMRGRGFSRGMMHGNRGNDPFRSRPPNTSRPPSMHVDDFVAMEIFQPGTSSSSTKRINLKQESSRGGRGRGGGGGGFDGGRDFGSSSRPHFFGSGVLGGYGHREDRGRGGSRGAGGQRQNQGVWNNNRGNMSLPSQPSNKSTPKFIPSSARQYNRGGRPMEPRSESKLSGPSRDMDNQGGGGRFQRVIRTGGNAAAAGHPWLNLRNKERDAGRLPAPNNPTGFGRRDNNRHARAFTR